MLSKDWAVDENVARDLNPFHVSRVGKYVLSRYNIRGSEGKVLWTETLIVRAGSIVFREKYHCYYQDCNAPYLLLDTHIDGGDYFITEGLVYDLKAQKGTTPPYTRADEFKLDNTGQVLRVMLKGGGWAMYRCTNPMESELMARGDTEPAGVEVVGNEVHLVYFIRPPIPKVDPKAPLEESSGNHTGSPSSQ